MMQSLLIANHCEIAHRVISTAPKIGIQTVAVNSDADIMDIHVGQADKAGRIDPVQTRDAVGLTLAADFETPIPERPTFGVFRM